MYGLTGDRISDRFWLRDMMIGGPSRWWHSDQRSGAHLCNLILGDKVSQSMCFYGQEQSQSMLGGWYNGMEVYFGKDWTGAPLPSAQMTEDIDIIFSRRKVVILGWFLCCWCTVDYLDDWLRCSTRGFTCFWCSDIKRIRHGIHNYMGRFFVIG